MDADKIEDLARMYNLLKRVDSLDQLQLHFGFYIKVGFLDRIDRLIDWSCG
jgi:hypothetical protein